MEIMKNRLFLFLFAILLLASCNSPRQIAFEEARRQGNYQPVAFTNAAGDKIEIWKAPSKLSGNPCFGKFLIAAVSKSGDLLDFCPGEFVSSDRPCFQSPRYVVLVAGGASGEGHNVFFVYDSQMKKFLAYSVDRFVPHVHENILVVGDDAFFTSCKTPRPLGRLNLATGKIAMFGAPAPQGASFYVAGSNVLVKGTDGKAYGIDGNCLSEVNTNISGKQPCGMSFDSVFMPVADPERQSPSENQPDNLEK